MLVPLDGSDQYFRGPRNWRSNFLGYEPLLENVSTVSQYEVVEQTRFNLINFQYDTFQPHLWAENPGGSYATAVEGTLGRYYGSYAKGQGFFVSAQPNDTTTGMYRFHALRLNSSASCTKVEPTSRDSICSSEPAFAASWASDNVTIEICAPGKVGVSPWNVATKDAQTITEELFISFVSARRYIDVTLHCVARSTLGYFELGNNFNNLNRSSLLPTFPSDTTSFDDRHAPRRTHVYTDWSDEYNVATRDPSAPTLPGPLMISTLALFGNSSFFKVLVNSNSSTVNGAIQALCTLKPFPFRRVDRSILPDCTYIQDASLTLLDLVYNLISRIEAYPQETLEVPMFFANEAVLSAAVNGYSPLSSGGSLGEIWTSPGVELRYPSVSLVGMIIVSILMGAQGLIIILLLVYLYHVPAWTETLDALAIARITTQIKDGDAIRRLGLRHLTFNDAKPLLGVEAMVGAIEPLHELTEIRAGTPRQPTVTSAGHSGHTAIERNTTPTEQGGETSAVTYDLNVSRQEFNGLGHEDRPPSPPSPLSQMSFAPPAIPMPPDPGAEDDLSQLPPAYAPRNTNADEVIRAVQLPTYSSLPELLHVGALGVITARTGRRWRTSATAAR
ncbi:hypothetical protein GQ53DRAFT_820327 [Thozetella sp. PMI_491]|nr:hypothetical protein GQ53DRAFT_820327 [Thozetella sp. PMI_491]